MSVLADLLVNRRLIIEGAKKPTVTNEYDSVEDATNLINKHSYPVPTYYVVG